MRIVCLGPDPERPNPEPDPDLKIAIPTLVSSRKHFYIHMTCQTLISFHLPTTTQN